MFKRYLAVSSQPNPTRQRSSAPWPLVLTLLTLAITAQAKTESANSKEIDLGRRIYMDGILASGEPLQGKRMQAVSVEGATAACQNCHRGSGMGSLEGNIVAPPVAGRFLFATAENRPLAIVDTRAASNLTRQHKPYTEASLSKAIREGVNVSGTKMNPLMPHYDLKPADIKALTAFLKQLSAKPSPGVESETLEFATIVTPGVDAKQREVFLAMTKAIVAQRNASQEARSGQMKMPLDLIPRTHRDWRLSVWELTGQPETWLDQLHAFYDKKPVFAVISGLSNSTWEPVNAFCLHKAIPCMLPNVDVVSDQPGFYNLYFSHGVTQEAQVLAKQLSAASETNPHRLLQIYSDNQAGLVAVNAATQALKGSKLQLDTRKLPGLEPAQLQEAFKDLNNKDDLVLWLNADELEAVSKAMPKLNVSNAYVSGFLINENFNALAKLGPNLRVVYPYELGEKREKNLQAVRQWQISWAIPMVNEPMQAEVYFNMLFLTDLVSQMLDNLHRDYMIERAEDMLSVGSNVSPYPHLGLSRGQRYASKGAYIAKLGGDGKLVAESDWIVP